MNWLWTPACTQERLQQRKPQNGVNPPIPFWRNVENKKILNIISEIDNCNSLYVSLPNYLLRKLQLVINRSAKLISSFPLQVPITSYLIELHWLPVKARIEFKICLLAFKALKFGEPKYLADLLNLQNVYAGMGLRTSDDPFRLEVLRASEWCFPERAFSYITPRLLNMLPASSKELDSIETFKSRLKTFMFTRAFDISDWSVNEGYGL